MADCVGGRDKRWRNFVKKSEGWVECWTVPFLSTVIQYNYHPLSAAGPAPQANVPTPEREELLLTPVRFPAAHSSLKVPKMNRNVPVDFDSSLSSWSSDRRSFTFMAPC